MYASSTAQTISELSAFERMLVSGGDGRIAIDPQTGRTRYYTPRGKACDETWFSSSTATAISVRGYDATRQACRSLGDASDIQLVSGCFHRIRARLLALFGIPGSEAILSGSGTELEIIALFLARSLMRGAATNLVVGPAETGRGKPCNRAGALGSGPACRRECCVAARIAIRAAHSPKIGVSSAGYADQSNATKAIINAIIVPPRCRCIESRRLSVGGHLSRSLRTRATMASTYNVLCATHYTNFVHFLSLYHAYRELFQCGRRGSSRCSHRLSSRDG